MKLKLMGKKQGMTRSFDKTGNVVTCTVIHAEPNVIAQIKTKERDGYHALQLGYEKHQVKDPRTLENRLSKALLGHYKKNSIEPCRYLGETRPESIEGYEVGQTLSVALFKEVSHVDVTAVSKGKGFQGVMKRHNFAGGRATHGSGFHRHGGSVGMRSTPGRTFPGQKKAGRMGGEQVTVQSLRVVAIDEELNLLVIEGAVPGAVGSLVTVAPAMKKQGPKKAKR